MAEYRAPIAGLLTDPQRSAGAALASTGSPAAAPQAPLAVPLRSNGAAGSAAALWGPPPSSATSRSPSSIARHPGPWHRSRSRARHRTTTGTPTASQRPYRSAGSCPGTPQRVDRRAAPRPRQPEPMPPPMPPGWEVAVAQEPFPWRQGNGQLKQRCGDGGRLGVYGVASAENSASNIRLHSSVTECNDHLALT